MCIRDRHELERRYAHFLKEPELSVIVKTATSQMVRTAAGAGRGGLADLSPCLLYTSERPLVRRDPDRLR